MSRRFDVDLYLTFDQDMEKVWRPGRYMALIQAASDVQEQGAVDDRDTLLHGIRDLLCIYSNVEAGLSTYVSAPGIVQQISALHSELRTLESDLEHTLPADRNRCINDLLHVVTSVICSRCGLPLIMQLPAAILMSVMGDSIEVPNYIYVHPTSSLQQLLFASSTTVICSDTSTAIFQYKSL
ncbi:hypothetical protein LIER_41651 [Lithospermum erythrorhizon]|uniref:Uncharacterized protein n=1 Tax=Lithospermum erythrorhizon TaxID=34254 RepID=A0AAV3RDX1_LITER